MCLGNLNHLSKNATLSYSREGNPSQCPKVAPKWSNIKVNLTKESVSPSNRSASWCILKRGYIARIIPTTGGTPWKFLKRSIFICSTTDPTRKKNTIKTCEFVLRRFTERFGQRDLASISQEDVLEFLLAMTKDNRQATKRNRYSVLASVYNFIINTGLPTLTNPCNSSVIRKIFKRPQAIQWTLSIKRMSMRSYSGPQTLGTDSYWNWWPEAAWESVKSWISLQQISKREAWQFRTQKVAELVRRFMFHGKYW